jgi:hypothetical protein
MGIMLRVEPRGTRCYVASLLARRGRLNWLCSLKFVSVHPGFVKTEAQLEYDRPMPMALSEEQAANHMVRAIERGGSDYMFPWVYKMLIKLAGILPKRLLGRILLLDLPEEYGQTQ